LLVVIAIIAILAALLLPALARANAEARLIECKNKLHQMGIALEMYVDDYRSQYPLYKGTTSPEGENWPLSWENSLGFYYPPPPGGVVFNPLNWTNASSHCPGYKGVVFAFIGLDFIGSYAYNQYGASRYVDAAGVPHGYGFRSWPDAPLKQSEVVAPSEMIAITEARTMVGIYTGNFSGYPSGSFVGCDWEAPGNSTVDPFTVVIQNPPQHGRLFNVVFCDGHVAATKVTDLLQDSKSAQLWNCDHQPHPEAWIPGW
jgi:prepilin-type processing-associated H-X9-DG protein